MFGAVVVVIGNSINSVRQMKTEGGGELDHGSCLELAGLLSCIELSGCSTNMMTDSDMLRRMISERFGASSTLWYPVVCLGSGGRCGVECCRMLFGCFSGCSIHVEVVAPGG